MRFTLTSHSFHLLPSCNEKRTKYPHQQNYTNSTRMRCCCTYQAWNLSKSLSNLGKKPLVESDISAQQQLVIHTNHVWCSLVDLVNLTCNPLRQKKPEEMKQLGDEKNIPKPGVLCTIFSVGHIPPAASPHGQLVGGFLGNVWRWFDLSLEMLPTCDPTWISPLDWNTGTAEVEPTLGIHINAKI